MSSHRTPAALSFPPHVVALGSLYTASMLLLETTRSVVNGPTDSEAERGENDVVQLLGNSGAWEQDYFGTAEQVDGTYRPGFTMRKT